MIEVTCAHCGLQILVPESVQGNKGLCFACGGSVQVPLIKQYPRVQNLSFTPGEILTGRYRVRQFLGRGGMGVVYSADDMLIGESVALKFMNPRLLSTHLGQQLFIREAQIARRLRHDHIVAVHDVGRLPEGILYLSMELISGRPLRHVLREYIKNKKYPTIRFAVNVVSQILDALAYAHGRVVHRDMKPENVLLLPGEWVKVLDFGLAIAVDSSMNKNVAAEKKGRVVGTEAYASPEQKLGQEIDHRSDLYSVGLILREILTLRTPRDPECDFSEVRKDISPSLAKVLERALAEERNSRWQSASEFRRALQDAFEKSYKSHVNYSEPELQHNRASTEGMIFLEGGSFLMGNNAYPDEAPQMEVHVNPFFIDRYPVTVREYERFLRATGHPQPRFWGDEHFNNPEQPVVGVSWMDAVAYCKWAGKSLPTEVEWEYAARGKENRKYPWGMAEPNPTRANYGDNLNMPSIVGMHEEGATPEGVHDLAGNVFEWTLDWFRPYAQIQEDNLLPPDPPLRVIRGGSWHSPPGELRTTFRTGAFPETQDNTIGFRCVVRVM